MNFKTFIFVIATFLSVSLGNAQAKKSAFQRLGTAEKFWLFTHPFKAKKAYRVSQEIKVLTDSLIKAGTLGNHHVGNQLDAFKHAFWMYTLAQEIGWRSAKRLGKAHEKANYQYYKENQEEDGVLPDRISSEMDLFNNAMGIKLYRRYKKVSKQTRIKLVMKAVLAGEMRMISQTKSRKYLDKNGNLIPKEKHYGLWENPKCLVPSKASYLLSDNQSKSLNL